MKQLILRLAIVVLLLGLTTAVAFAHPQIVTTEPAANAQLDDPPDHVQITFNEPIEAAFAELRVYDARSQEVDRGDGGRDPQDATMMSVDLPPLDAGVYTVTWQAIGSDGHLVKGYYAFRIVATTETTPTVAAASPAATSSPEPDVAYEPLVGAPPPDTSSNATLPGLLAFLRALMLIGAVTAAGCWAFVTLIATPLAPAEFSKALSPRLWRPIGGALLLLTLSTPLYLLAHTASVAGNLAPESLINLMRDTRLGQALVVRFALALALLSLTRRTERWSGWQRYGGLLNAALLLLTFSISGHAAAKTDPLPFIALDWIHLSATSIWVGGLVAMAQSLAPLGARHTTNDLAVVEALMKRFSRLALASVIVLTITGAVAAFYQLRTLEDLWLTNYGRALSLKLMLFGLLIGFGAYHLLLTGHEPFRRLSVALGDLARRVSRMRQTIPFEALLAVLTIGIAGLLTSLPTPGAESEVASAPAPIAAPTAPAVEPTVDVASFVTLPTRTPAPIVAFDGEEPAGDLRVRLSVKPGSLGENAVAITVLDAAGRPHNVQRVQLTVTMLEMDMGESKSIAEEMGDGTYVVRDQPFSMVGDWRVQVLVRRVDADDVIADFMVPIGG